MICDKCSIHSTDFYLHYIFEKPTSDQIKVLSLKAFVYPSFHIDVIVFI